MKKKKKLIILSIVVISIILSISIYLIIKNNPKKETESNLITNKEEALEYLNNYYPDYEFEYINNNDEFYKFKLTTDDNIQYWIRKEDGTSVPHYAETSAINGRSTIDNSTNNNSK